MRFVLTPIGSAGDVFPFLGMALKLRERGHAVSMVTNGHFQRLIESHGIEFDAFGSEEDYQRAIHDPDLFHPMRGFKTVVNLVRDQRGLMQLIRKQARGDALVVGHTMSWAANLLEEKGELPAATVVLAPAVLRSTYHGPVMQGEHGITRLPRWAQRGMWWMVDRFFVDPPIAAILDDLRREMGLPRVRRFFRDWIHSPRLNIGAFPEWFGPMQPDWPASTRLTSFPLCDWVSDRKADAELLDLIQRERPFVFTPGTGNIHGHQFFDAAVQACQAAGTSCLLLTPHREQLPARLPEHVYHRDFAPLSQILPHCSGLAHHGGIGTTAAAIAAGIPQIVMPLSHDQPDNAARVVRLHLGDRLQPRQFTADRLQNVLIHLRENESITEQCRLRQQQLAAADGLTMMCDLLEQAARR